ncbi:MAG: hypothetical protein AB1758_01160 [Candidatus Eremiobacterota bacterium]
MQQARFSLTHEQIKFLEDYRRYGFRDRSEVVRTALEALRKEVERRELELSADLYAALYATDVEGREWGEGAVTDWPS